jgi:hypothetical protein
MNNNNGNLYNHNMELIKAALPYVSHPARKSMQLLIKTNELVETLNGTDDSDEVAACDLENDAVDIEAMLLNMRELCTGKELETVDMMLNFIKAQRLFNTYRSYTAKEQNAEDGSQNPGNAPNLMEFILSQLTPEQKSNFETMSMMLNTINS